MDSSKVCGILMCSFLLLVLLGDPTAACLCRIRHLQTAFCQADVLIRAKFVGIKPQASQGYQTDKQYIIKTTKVYKAPPGMEDIQFLHTSAFDGLCGYTHKGKDREEEYIVEGRLLKDEVRISICSYIKPWAQLSSEQKHLLSSEYKGGCTCNIVPCYSDSCSISDDECLWTDGSQATHMACVPQPEIRNRCGWILLEPEGPAP